MASSQVEITRDLFDKADNVENELESDLGINEKVVRLISKQKKEPSWMLDKRLEALNIFNSKPMPKWGADLSSFDLQKIRYYMKPNAKPNQKNWEDVPKEIKDTFQRLGIPEAEQKALAGAGAQYESENVYHNLKEEWQKLGVIFEDMDVGLQKYPDIVEKHFMTNNVPLNDHKFAALHGAVWSGGTFLYIPKNVNVKFPLQAYFRMNKEQGGQFEHTMIIVEDGAQGHYIEGCSAPQYNQNSLHAGCVEVFVGENSRFRYSSVENWSRNTYNLNTKRALVKKNGIMEWVGGNLGSGVTMLYPCSILLGENSKADHIGIAYAGKGQNQDTGAKVIHAAPGTSSSIVSKSICKDGGITTYRGLVMVNKGAVNSKVSAVCDALILDGESTNNTIPYMDIKEKKVHIAHEATVGKISEENLFYLMSRGMTEQDAYKMLVSGFMEPVMKELPIEYAVEMNKLIEMEMEGSVG